MLGAVVEEAFKDQHYVQLHSFPSPNGEYPLNIKMMLSKQDRLAESLMNAYKHICANTY